LAAFGAPVRDSDHYLPALGEAARIAGAAIPGKQYYQAYDVWLEDIIYDPATPP